MGAWEKIISAAISLCETELFAYLKVTQKL